MGASAIPVVIFTLLWGVVGIVLPFLLPKGPNRGILQAVLILTAFTCWLFWLCCYMAQMNPLVGPKLSNTTLLIMSREWFLHKPLRVRERKLHSLPSQNSPKRLIFRTNEESHELQNSFTQFVALFVGPKDQPFRRILGRSFCYRDGVPIKM